MLHLKSRFLKAEHKGLVVDVDKEFPIPNDYLSGLPIAPNMYKKHFAFIAQNDVKAKDRLMKLAEVSRKKDVTLICTKAFHRSQITIIRDWIYHYREFAAEYVRGRIA